MSGYYSPRHMYLARLDGPCFSVRPPNGTLILAGVGTESWAFALTHGFKPPFTTTDVTERALVISDSSLHCCDAPQWNDHTQSLRRSRVSDGDDP